MSNTKLELQRIVKEAVELFMNKKEIKLSSANVIDSDIMLMWDDSEEPGTEIFSIVEDEEGNIIEKNNVEAGEYNVEGDKIIVVDEDSKLVEVKDAVEVEEEKTEEEDKTELEEDETVVETVENVATIESNFNVESLLSLINSDQDGYHTVDFSVEDGKIVFGSVYSQTYKSLLSLKEEKEVKLSELEQENSELKDKIDIMLKETPTNDVNLNEKTIVENVKLSFKDRKIQELAEKRKNR